MRDFFTGGDDTDFTIKLWNENVRILKGLVNHVYHLDRNYEKDKSLFTYLGGGV